MADNTQLNLGVGGDLARTVAKTANAPAKTQAVILDVGGGLDSSPETALSVGQKTLAGSLSVGLASDQGPIPASQSGSWSMSISGSIPAGSNVIGGVTQSGSWAVTANDGGAAITGATIPAGGSGLTGWLSAIWTRQGTTPSQDGTDSTGVTQLAGGVGIRGWLSGIFSKLSGTLAISETGGAAITGSAMPAGGAGLTGWLSATYTKITATFGPVVPGTAATQSQLGAAVYNSTPPTLTTGQQAALQADANGFLKVNVAAGGASGGTSSNFGAAFPGIGTAAGAEYLSSPPTLTSGQMVALQTDVNGNLKVAGSFFQATQPVSIASMPSTPVTGTFFQATQPVSIAASVAITAAALPLPAGAAADGTDATGVTPLTGAVGLRGWLSSLYASVTSFVSALGTSAGKAITIQGAASGVAIPVNKPVAPAAFSTTSAIPISSTAATPTIAARTGAPGTGRVTGMLVNSGTVAAFLGNAAVSSGSTTPAGWPLNPGDILPIDTTAALYIVTATGSSTTVAFLETF